MYKILIMLLLLVMATAPAMAEYGNFSAIFGLKVYEITSKSVSVMWYPVPDVTEYWIYRNGDLVTITSDPSYTDKNLTPATLYTYSIKAVGRGMSSSSYSVETKPADSIISKIFSFFNF